MGRHRAHRLAHLGERGHGRWVIALDKRLEFFGGYVGDTDGGCRSEAIAAGSGPVGFSGSRE